MSTLQEQIEAAMGGYSESELRAAFEIVENRDHWKLPIDAIIPALPGCVRDEETVDRVRHAVPFFAGCEAIFDATRFDGGVRVRAIGYYEAIGA